MDPLCPADSERNNDSEGSYLSQKAVAGPYEGNRTNRFPIIKGQIAIIGRQSDLVRAETLGLGGIRRHGFKEVARGGSIADLKRKRLKWMQCSFQRAPPSLLHTRSNLRTSVLNDVV
jgi:hypothetical protein